MDFGKKSGWTYHKPNACWFLWTQLLQAVASELPWQGVPHRQGKVLFCTEASAPMFSPQRFCFGSSLFPSKKEKQKETQGTLFGRRLCDASLCTAEHHSMALPAAISADTYGASLKLCSPWPLAFGSRHPPPGSHSYPSNETHKRKGEKIFRKLKASKKNLPKVGKRSQAQRCKPFLRTVRLSLCGARNVPRMYLAQRERQRTVSGLMRLREQAGTILGQRIFATSPAGTWRKEQ